MIVFVEGPAGAGKTSFVKLAHHMCDDFEILDEYVRAEDESVPKGFRTFIANTEAKLNLLANNDGEKHILVDRGHLSMLVNATIEHEYGLNDSLEEIREWIDSKARDNELVKPDLYVYITAPPEMILDRAQQGGWYREDLGWTRDPDMAMDVYEDVFKEHADGVPIMRLDGSKNSDELVSEFLKTYESYLE